MQIFKLLTGTCGYVEWSSSSYLIRIENINIVIDTGSKKARPLLLKALKDLQINPEDIDIIINTHLHMDHCWNNDLFTDSCIYYSDKEYTLMHNVLEMVSADETSKQRVFEDYLHSFTNSPSFVKRMLYDFVFEDRMLEKINKMNRVDVALLESLGLKIVETPGHTDGHISVIYDNYNLKFIFSGDLIINENYFKDYHRNVLFTKNISQYQTSKAIIESFEGIFFPGHGREFSSHMGH